MNFCKLKKILGLTKTFNKSHAPKEILNEEVKFPKGEMIISETNEKGFITYANQTFIEMSGYKKNELLCANHNLIRHPDMPKITFKLLWESVLNGNLFEGFVKNLRKDGKYYLVYVKVKKKGKKTFISVREEVNYAGWKEMERIYKELLKAEKNGGITASYKLLKEKLGSTDNDFLKKYLKFVRTKQYN